ncbi:MAG TPA: WhiB family transcriptional regulator [Acidimicrobiales bacterium]|nr:WhiB family transcriptional regulator [Acidimicrobiales bacterium]
MTMPRFDRDSWKRQALCAGHPDRGAWFSDQAEAIQRAKAVCRACPVNAECLGFALQTGPHDGIWAGTSPYERRRLRRVMASAS